LADFPEGKAPDVYDIGDCVDLRADLDAMEKRKCLAAAGTEPRSSAVQLVV
jgi:hypothetical protein